MKHQKLLSRVRTLSMAHVKLKDRMDQIIFIQYYQYISLV